MPDKAKPGPSKQAVIKPDVKRGYVPPPPRKEPPKPPKTSK